MPTAADVAVICTNLREMNGNRPVFADAIDSVFVFPLMHIRFIEIAPGTMEQTVDDERPQLQTSVAPVPVAEPDEAEIDDSAPGPRRSRHNSGGSVRRGGGRLGEEPVLDRTT